LQIITGQLQSFWQTVRLVPSKAKITHFPAILSKLRNSPQRIALRTLLPKSASPRLVKRMSNRRILDLIDDATGRLKKKRGCVEPNSESTGAAANQGLG